MCVWDVVRFLWPAKLSSWKKKTKKKKKKNQWKVFFFPPILSCFAVFPCAFLELLETVVVPPCLFVTRENNKVIKSFWGVFGCGWCRNTELLRLWFSELSLSLYLLSYCVSKAFSFCLNGKNIVRAFFQRFFTFIQLYFWHHSICFIGSWQNRWLAITHFN